MKTKNAGHDEESGSSRQRQTKRRRETITVEEALMPVVSHPHLLWRTCNTQTRKDYNRVLSTLYQKSPYAPYLLEWEVLNRAGCAEEIEEMITIKLAWRNVFDIRENVYKELCLEFYSTFGFDETLGDDKVMTEKSVYFRLGGKKHSLKLLEFGVALGLYTQEAVEDEYFEEYFIGGVRNEVRITNEALNEFWAKVSTEESLILSKRKVSTIKRNVLKVRHKMIVYLLCQRTTGFDKIQRMECWLLSLFEKKNMGELAKRLKVFTEENMATYSAPTTYRAFDNITLWDLFDDRGKLKPDVAGDETVRHPPPPKEKKTSLVEKVEH
ncbi:retrotransposon Orf1 [Artemisia annua]|uniref:Retrotransposon Orf1 n=1 Tax=Artemisia annua TaxID=35608 RepID=A0A2U1Q040_ARTAN|nr:retrotransposon Orf1 [Artemisia annua]